MALHGCGTINTSANLTNFNLSAGTTSTNLSNVVFSDSNRVSFGLNGSTVTAKHALNFSGGTTSNNISDQIIFSNSNRVSFGLNGSTMTAQHALNFSAGTTSNNISDGITFSNSNGFSFGLNGSTMTVNEAFQSYHRFWDPANTITFSVVQSTSYIQPFELSKNLSMDRIRLIASAGFGASTTQSTVGGTSYSMSAVTTNNMVFYTRGAGASSLSLQYYTSAGATDQCLMTMSINANSTQYSVSLRYTLGSESFTKDYSISQNSLQWHTSHITDLSGVKQLDQPCGISLSPGQYWLAYGRSTTSNTGNAAISEATKLIVSMNSMMFVSNNTLQIGTFGSGTNSSVGWLPAHGSFSTGGAGGTTSSVNMTAVSTGSSNQGLYAQLMRIV